jgi:hypothetical protein
MKTRFFLHVGLLALILLSACAPATPQPTISVPPTPVQAVATSRGPDLEATDPNMVILASGRLQLVEFFRFT